MTDLQRALVALKHESDSGVLYRSRLSATAVPAVYPPSGLQSGVQSATAASQASMGWSQTPVQGAPPLPHPPSQVPQPPGSQHAMPQPLMQPPPRKSSNAMILGLVGGAVALAAVAGGGWWWTHRTPAAVVAVLPPEPAQPAKVEPPVVVQDPIEVAKALEGTKAPPDAKGKDTKQAATAPAPATKGVAAQKSASPAPPVAATAPKEITPVPLEASKSPVTPPAPRNTASVTVPDGRPFMIRLNADVPNDADEGTPLRFTVKEDLKIGDLLVIAKGATVTGQIVNGGKKRIIGSTKMTMRLIDAETTGGKLRLRSLPGRRADGNYERPVDTGVKKSKDVAAGSGTEYVAYVDSEQTLTVRK